jgi:hypothetical protein
MSSGLSICVSSTNEVGAWHKKNSFICINEEINISNNCACEIACMVHLKLISLEYMLLSTTVTLAICWLKFKCILKHQREGKIR